MSNILKRLGFAIKNNFNSDEFLSYKQSFLSGSDIPQSGTAPNVSGNLALKLTTVFACCRVLAETFASVPIKEYKKLPNGDREETDDLGYLDIFKCKANSEMSAYNAKEMAMNQINLGGNVVFTKGKNTLGETIELTPHPWQNVKIERNQETQKLQYIIKVSNNEELTLSREDVFHVAGPSLDGIIGMSPIVYGNEAIKLGKTYEEFGQRFYQNGVNSTGFFEHEGALDDAPYERLKNEIARNWSGLRNTGKPILLEDGLKFNPLSINLVDAELLSSKKYQNEDICRMYRVPLHLVQNLDKATNNNIEHQSLEFGMYTMLPHFVRWENNIGSQLLTKKDRAKGYYYEFNMASLLRGDQKSMAESFALGRQWGYLSVNDIRRMLNMNKIENGEIYLEPMNMVEAGVPDPKIVDQIKKLMDNRG